MKAVGVRGVEALTNGYKVRIERKMSARVAETSADVILSVGATQAIDNGPLLEENVRTRNDRVQNSFISPSESDQ